MAEKTISFENMISTLLEAKRYSSLKDVFITMNAADIALIFNDLPEKSLPVLFRLLPKELAADTFVEMDPDAQEVLVQGFSDSELKDVIDELYVDDAADIVDEMPANVVNRILKQADPEMRRMINEILKYPENSAGSIMTTEYVELKPETTAAEAIKQIKKTGIDKETINVCYVTDAKKLLVGFITIRTLIMAPDNKTVGELMSGQTISVVTGEDKEIVAQMFVKYDFYAMPVVDTESRLVGIVTVDDAVDVLVDEATEDIEKMAAITPDDRPYLKTSVFGIWKNRIPWLMLLMISATFTGLIITHFEDALSSYVVLTAYIPMLMDTGGNSGSQASVTIIRSMSLNELDFKDIFRVIWKECRVSLLCAAALAVVSFAKLMLLDRVSMTVAAVVCLTLACTVVVAKLIGCTLPMIAKKIKLDPAVCASPFITTAVDALSLLIYFTIASSMLNL